MTLAFPKPVRQEREPKRLQRKTWMRKSRPRRLERAGSDPGRLAFCRSLPCVGKSRFPGHICRGIVEASHLRHQTGIGRKEPDNMTAPKCSELHRQWEQHRGAFAAWTNFERFAWMTNCIAEVEACWLALTDEDRAWWREVGAQRSRSS